MFTGMGLSDWSETGTERSYWLSPGGGLASAAGAGTRRGSLASVSPFQSDQDLVVIEKFRNNKPFSISVKK